MKHIHRRSRTSFDLSHINIKKYKKVDIIIDNKTCNKYHLCKVGDNKYVYVDFTVVNGELSLYKVYDDNITISKGDIVNKIKTNYIINYTGVKIDECEKTYYIFINDDLIAMIKVNILKNTLKLKSLTEYQWLSSIQYIINNYVSITNKLKKTELTTLPEIIVSSGIASYNDFKIIKDMYLTHDENVQNCDNNVNKLDMSFSGLFVFGSF